MEIFKQPEEVECDKCGGFLCENGKCHCMSCVNYYDDYNNEPCNCAPLLFSGGGVCLYASFNDED